METTGDRWGPLETAAGLICDRSGELKSEPDNACF